MQSREADQLFTYACPKFVSPALPDYDEELTIHNSSPLQIQHRLFIKEVLQQAPLPTIRNYLKLYSTIDIDKLSNLLDKKVDKETLRTYLIRFVHKNRQLQWSTGLSPIQGNWSSSTKIDYFIDGEMIHVIDNTVTKRYGEVFLRECIELEETIADLIKKD